MLLGGKLMKDVIEKNAITFFCMVMFLITVMLERVFIGTHNRIWESAVLVVHIIAGSVLDFFKNRRKSQNRIDHLTGLLNVQSFWSDLEKFKNDYVSLLVMDIDNFKDFNDRKGHLAGDDLLKTYGCIIKNHFEKLGKCYRFGGEEFVVLLPGMNNHEAHVLAEDFRKTIENQEINTVSIGLSSTSERDFDSQVLFYNADIAMYQAKKSKNKVFNKGVLHPERGEI